MTFKIILLTLLLSISVKAQLENNGLYLYWGQDYTKDLALLNAKLGVPPDWQQVSKWRCFKIKNLYRCQAWFKP